MNADVEDSVDEVAMGETSNPVTGELTPENTLLADLTPDFTAGQAAHFEQLSSEVSDLRGRLDRTEARLQSSIRDVAGWLSHRL